MEFYNKIHCKFTGIKGFLTLYNDGLRYHRYMLTEKAKKKFKVLVFWEKYGQEATIAAFGASRRTLFNWKSQFEQGGRKPEALNEKKRTPKTKRKRLWPEPVVSEIKRLRVDLFNRKLIDWLVWYNTERPHWAFQNRLSPIQFILSLQPTNLPQECNFGWTYTIDL